MTSLKQVIHAGVEPAEKVREISDADYEDYWTRVKTNLAAKRLRLVFVADEIPASLQTIVESLTRDARRRGARGGGEAAQRRWRHRSDDPDHWENLDGQPPRR